MQLLHSLFVFIVIGRFAVPADLIFHEAHALALVVCIRMQVGLPVQAWKASNAFSIWSKSWPSMEIVWKPKAFAFSSTGAGVHHVAGAAVNL